MVPGLLGAHLAGDGEAVVLTVLVVALDVKVGEVDGDPPLGRGDDLPDAVLVAGVDVGEGGAGDGPVGSVDDATAGVLTSTFVRVKFITDPAGAGVASKSVDTFMFTSMIWSMTFIIFLVKLAIFTFIHKYISSRNFIIDIY